MYTTSDRQLFFRFIVGSYEEKDYTIRSSQSGGLFRQQLNNPIGGSRRWQPPHQKNMIFAIISQMLRFYKKIVYKMKCCHKHKTCPHPFSCLYYTMEVRYVFEMNTWMDEVDMSQNSYVVKFRIHIFKTHYVYVSIMGVKQRNPYMFL